MPKLRVELDGPRLTECVILKDGQPQTQVTWLAVVMDAKTRDQLLNIGSAVVIDGELYESSVSHTISKATLTIEYQEV